MPSNFQDDQACTVCRYEPRPGRNRAYGNQDTVHVTNLPILSAKVGHNAPCPCGSGKKFEKCCGGANRSVN